MAIDVSIVVVTYNYGNYLKYCLDSCLSQYASGLAYEVILVDDGSTDDTDNLLRQDRYRSVRKFKISNSGIEKASNFGFGKSQGKYIVRVDADDQLELDYLRLMAPHLNKSLDFIYADYYIMNQDGDITDEQVLPNFEYSEILSRGDFLATGTLFSKDLLREIGGYSEEIKNCGLENYEFILKSILGGAKALHVSNKLFRYRRHNLNISELKREQIVCFGRDLFNRLGLGQYSTNIFHPYKLKLE